MDKLIRYLAEKLEKNMRQHNWGAIALPLGNQLNFNFTDGCYLEIEGIGSRCFNIINFNGQWLTVEDYEYELRELFGDFKFTNKQINRFLRK